MTFVVSRAALYAVFEPVRRAKADATTPNLATDNPMSSHDPRHNRGRAPQGRDPRRQPADQQPSQPQSPEQLDDLQLRAQLLARQRRRQRQQQAPAQQQAPVPQQQQPHHRPQPHQQAPNFSASEDATHVASAADLRYDPSAPNPFADEDEATQIKSDIPKDIGQMFVNRKQPAKAQPHQQRAGGAPKTAFSIPEKTEIQTSSTTSSSESMKQAMRARQDARRKEQAQSAPAAHNPARTSGNYNPVGNAPHTSGQYPQVQRSHAAPINHTSAQPAISARHNPANQHPAAQAPRTSGQYPHIGHQPARNVSGQFPQVGHAHPEAPTTERNRLVLAPEEAGGLDEATAASINVPQHATGFFPGVNKQEAVAPSSSPFPTNEPQPPTKQPAEEMLPEVSDPQRAASWEAAAVGLNEAFSTPIEDVGDSPLHTRQFEEKVIVLNRRWPKDGEVPTQMRISYGVWGGAFGAMVAIALCVLLTLVQGAMLSSMFQMLVGLTVMAAGAAGAACAALPRKVEELLLKTGMLPDDP